MRTVVKTVFVVLTLVALYLLFLLRRLVLMVFVALIFASALRPIAIMMQRRLRLPQTAAALTLYGLSTLGLVGGTAAVVPSLISGTLDLLNRSGQIYGPWHELALSLRASAHAYLHVDLPLPPPVSQVEAWVAGLTATAQRGLPNIAVKSGTLMAEVFLGLIMAYYWLGARDEFVSLGQHLLPARHRRRFLLAFDEIEQVLGAYLGSQLILSLVVGAACFVAFVALGLPYAGPLALLEGLLNMVPLVGAGLGAIPAILVGGSISPAKGLLTGLAIFLIQQVENNFVAPKVLEQRIGLNPLFVIIVLAAGTLLGGIVGGLIALPVAGALWIVIRHLFVEPAIRRAAAQEEGGPAQAGAQAAGDAERPTEQA